MARQLPKSIGCSKNFLGRESLHTRLRVEEWTRSLAEELADRLQEDQLMVRVRTSPRLAPKGAVDRLEVKR